MTELHLAPDEIERITTFAVERGLGELTPAELEYIDAAMQYNYYAEDVQMPYWVATEKSATWHEMETSVGAERANAIVLFADWLWEDPNEDPE